MDGHERLVHPVSPRRDGIALTVLTQGRVRKPAVGDEEQLLDVRHIGDPDNVVLHRAVVGQRSPAVFTVTLRDNGFAVDIAAEGGHVKAVFGQGWAMISTRICWIILYPAPGQGAHSTRCVRGLTDGRNPF